MRSPSESMAADIAETRSSSTPCGSAEAIVSPSTLTIAEASISGEDACNSRRRSTIIWVRDFVKAALLAWCVSDAINFVWNGDKLSYYFNTAIYQSQAERLALSQVLRD